MEGVEEAGLYLLPNAGGEDISPQPNKLNLPTHYTCIRVAFVPSGRVSGRGSSFLNIFLSPRRMPTTDGRSLVLTGGVPKSNTNCNKGKSSKTVRWSSWLCKGSGTD